MSPETPTDPSTLAAAPPNNATGSKSLNPEDFALLSVLGVGSFGVVRLAKHSTSGRPVALKVLAKEAIAATRRQRLVERERGVHARLSHPLVAQLVGAFQDRDRVYLAIEFLPGGELWSLLYGGTDVDTDDNNKADSSTNAQPTDEGDKQGELRPMSPVQSIRRRSPVLDAAGARRTLLDPGTGGLCEFPAAFYVACMASALRYLHGVGVLYRDLKLENVVLDARGYAKLVDFGFATLYNTGDASDQSTRRSTLCGSADYMAPEVLQRTGRHDPRVDLWALGVVLFELLVGHTPFHHDNPRELARRVLHDPVSFPEGFEASHPLAVDLILKLLVKNPAERLQSVQEVQDHGFFRQFFPTDESWARLERREVPAPFVPRLDGDFDASFFRQFDADELLELEDDVLPYEDDESGDFAGF